MTSHFNPVNALPVCKRQIINNIPAISIRLCDVQAKFKIHDDPQYFFKIIYYACWNCTLVEPHIFKDCADCCTGRCLLALHSISSRMNKRELSDSVIFGATRVVGLLAYYHDFISSHNLYSRVISMVAAYGTYPNLLNTLTTFGCNYLPGCLSEEIEETMDSADTFAAGTFAEEIGTILSKYGVNPCYRSVPDCDINFLRSDGCGEGEIIEQSLEELVWASALLGENIWTIKELLQSEACSVSIDHCCRLIRAGRTIAAFVVVGHCIKVAALRFINPSYDMFCYVDTEFIESLYLALNELGNEIPQDFAMIHAAVAMCCLFLTNKLPDGSFHDADIFCRVLCERYDDFVFGIMATLMTPWVAYDVINHELSDRLYDIVINRIFRSRLVEILTVVLRAKQPTNLSLMLYRAALHTGPIKFGRKYDMITSVYYACIYSPEDDFDFKLVFDSDTSQHILNADDDLLPVEYTPDGPTYQMLCFLKKIADLPPLVRKLKKGTEISMTDPVCHLGEITCCFCVSCEYSNWKEGEYELIDERNYYDDQLRSELLHSGEFPMIDDSIIVDIGKPTVRSVFRRIRYNPEIKGYQRSELEL